MPRPLPGSHPAYFDKYIDLVHEADVHGAFEAQHHIAFQFFDTITEDGSAKAYAPGKWTLKEMLQHLVDSERIFNYRALAFARREEASLPSFDENNYADNSFANERSWQSLLEEWKAVRTTTELLFKSFNTDMLNAAGIANGNSTTVNAMGFIIVGHLSHHVSIIKERYLSSV